MLVGANNLVGSAPTYSDIALWPSRVRIPTWGPFPIPPHLSLPLRFLSALMCPIIIKGKNAKNKSLKKDQEHSYLKSLDDLLNVLSTVVMRGKYHTLPTFVEDLDAHDARRPADDIPTGAVKNHVLGLLFDQHDELVGNPQQALHVRRLAEIPCHHAPRDGSHALEMGVLPRLHPLLLLGPQRDEAELHCRVHRRRAHEVLREVLEVLLPRAGCHGTELLRFVRRVFPVDHLGQQEVPEDGRLGKGHAFRNGRAERRHVFGSGYRNTAKMTTREIVWCN